MSKKKVVKNPVKKVVKKVEEAPTSPVKEVKKDLVGEPVGTEDLVEDLKTPEASPDNLSTDAFVDISEDSEQDHLDQKLKTFLAGVKKRDKLSQDPKGSFITVITGEHYFPESFVRELLK